MNKTLPKAMPSATRRVRSFGIMLASALALISPGFLSTFASAAQITSRSIALTSSVAGAQNVTYTVNFTAANAAGAFVIQFCSNSPFIPSTCTAPTGFDSSSAASTTSGFTDVTGSTNKIVVAGTITQGQNVSLDISGITNPTTAGAFYARIVTYTAKTDAQNYTDTPLSANAQDQGGVAINITDQIGVSAAVLETMTFCVAGDSSPTGTPISDNCNLTGRAKPTLQLGETVGNTIALSPTVVSTGNVWTQISTNAVGGAVVSMKSSATNCGGLLRAGDATACDISPAQNADITAGQAKFGVKTTTATNGTQGAGTLEPVTGSDYSNSAFGMHFVAGNATGVTSPYGDPFLDTAAAPANNKNMELIFGASASNSTPAGNYSADISLIATGTF